ncbi:MAG: acyl--CoA ligase [Sphingomonadaceae bacterium]|nr:acyl--CoA ligase [Sphingomonadaceae bacterium]
MSSGKSGPEHPGTAETFPKFIRAAAAAYGDEVFGRLESEDGPGESLSYVDVERRSAELAKGLLVRGLGKGTRVGFIYGNSPSFVVVMSAIIRIGAIAIPISTMIKGNELIRVLRQSDVAGLVLQREFLGKDYVERVCDALPGVAKSAGQQLFLPQAPFLRWIVSTGEGLPASIGNLDDIYADGAAVSEDMLVEVESEVYSTDQMIEIYTSGSMALPKGVKHNHGPVLFRGDYIGRMQGAKRGVEGLCFLPMFWIGGLFITLFPNWAHGAPTLFTERTNINSRAALGSVLSTDDIAAMADNMFKPYWGLGMTETLGPYSFGDEVRAPGHPMCAPMDHFADRYEVRIADENNEPVGDGEIGQMQVRGYPVSTGLHKIEQDKFFTPDGYFCTGDMCLVEGTRVHFVGRGGDMIKTASSNVSPAEVEMELQSIEGVHNAYVVGIPDKERGQLVVAALVARDDADALDFGEIEAQMRKNMSGYKVPRAYVQIDREEIPMLHSNKVSKRLLADMMIERLGREDLA